jgi:hypothetical protein
VKRRFVKAAGALGILLTLMAGRAEGCRKKDTTPGNTPGKTPAHWITPLMTPPPPRPTVTLWPGVTRAPQLPE